MDEGNDTNEDEEVPSKKTKIDGEFNDFKDQFSVDFTSSSLGEQKVQPVAEKKSDVVMDEVAEAEAKAAKERQMVPLEIRVKQFKDMLKEKEVSAFSTWEKELHKIVFDPRYLLLASKERKQVFEKYVKDRAEDERREKRHKMQKKRDEFKALMEEANLHSR
jgi:transcription elongation regulator 1